MRHMIATNVLLAAVTGFCSAPSNAIVIVANAKNPTQALSDNEVKNMYLGKLNQFPSGNRVVVIDHENGATREAFLKSVLQKTDVQYKAYWARLAFTGSGTPPKQVTNDVATLDQVERNPDAIGYVDDASIDLNGKNVKVLYQVK